MNIVRETNFTVDDYKILFRVTAYHIKARQSMKEADELLSELSIKLGNGLIFNKE